MNREQVGKEIPQEANVFLRPDDVAAVADYVLAHIKGKGEPTYGECTDFFGTTSRVCDIYKPKAPAATAATNPGQPK
jgi:hypothetical protein